jgi:hypothetical protein
MFFQTRKFEMGVHLEMLVWGRKKPVDITPGWRSMMHGLLYDEGLIGLVTCEDVPVLRRLAKDQLKGEREPPFDWAQDIADNINAIADAVEKHGHVIVEAHW